MTENTITRVRGGMIYETVMVPDNCVVCLECKGRGQVRWRYSEPSFTNNPAVSDYWPCIYCEGQGYVEKELHKRMQKLESLKKQTKRT